MDVVLLIQNGQKLCKIVHNGSCKGPGHGDRCRGLPYHNSLITKVVIVSEDGWRKDCLSQTNTDRRVLYFIRDDLR